MSLDSELPIRHSRCVPGWRLIPLLLVTSAVWFLLLMPPDWLPRIEHPGWRRGLQSAVHVLCHAGIAWQARLSFQRFGCGVTFPRAWLAFAVLSAVLSEVVQLWAPGRVVDPVDLGCNLAGVEVAVLVMRRAVSPDSGSQPT